MNILFALNDAYADKLVVALRSLLVNNPEIIDDLHIWIRSNDIQKNTMRYIIEIFQEFGGKNDSIKFCDAEIVEKTIKNASLATFKGNNIAYYKILCLDELDIDDSLLVLDCDLMIFSGIKELYNENLNGKLLGAVKNPPNPACYHGTDITMEYNTGVMLIDMKRYKELDVTKYLMQYAGNLEREDWHTGDQTLISLGLAAIDEIELLAPQYNIILNMTYFNGREFMCANNVKGGYYSAQQYDEGISKMTILHLIDGMFVRVPWEDIHIREKYTTMWFEYLSDFRIESRKDRYFKNKNKINKLLSLLNILMPRTIYIKLIAIVAKKMGW